MNNVHRNMYAEYVDTPNSADTDFEDEDKIHILVMGISFGRDFANIHKESSISNSKYHIFMEMMLQLKWIVLSKRIISFME